MKPTNIQESNFPLRACLTLDLTSSASAHVSIKGRDAQAANQDPMRPICQDLVNGNALFKLKAFGKSTDNANPRVSFRYDVISKEVEVAEIIAEKSMLSM